jgi:hypothetical protein
MAESMFYTADERARVRQVMMMIHACLAYLWRMKYVELSPNKRDDLLGVDIEVLASDHRIAEAITDFPTVAAGYPEWKYVFTSNRVSAKSSPLLTPMQKYLLADPSKNVYGEDMTVHAKHWLLVPNPDDHELIDETIEEEEEVDLTTAADGGDETQPSPSSSSSKGKGKGKGKGKVDRKTVKGEPATSEEENNDKPVTTRLSKKKAKVAVKAEKKEGKGEQKEKKKKKNTAEESDSEGTDSVDFQSAGDDADQDSGDDKKGKKGGVSTITTYHAVDDDGEALDPLPDPPTDFQRVYRTVFHRLYNTHADDPMARLDYEGWVRYSLQIRGQRQARR